VALHCALQPEECALPFRFLDDAQYRTPVDGAELWFRALVECGRTYG
jgi:hypothetical protein